MIVEREVIQLAVCKGCKKRKVGCKKSCLEYVVETIVNQPEKEKEEKARKEAVAKYTDKTVRLNRTKTCRVVNKSVFKSTKKGVVND